MSAALDHARQEWEESHRRLEEASGDRDYRQLVDALELVTEELRRRVGQTFTLADLAREYRAADTWVRDVVSESGPGVAMRALPVVTGAAFHAYARGAVDFTP